MNQKVNLKALIAEFLGSFTLIFIGAGTAAANIGGMLGVALAFGMTLTVQIYLFSGISGAQINPAVTLGLALLGEIDWATAVLYWIAQFLGGVAAGAMLFFVYGGATNGLGATTLGDGITQVQGVVLEVILAFFLFETIYLAGIKKYAGQLAGAVIGLTLAFCILLSGPLTGASLNPARSLGPAIFAGAWNDFWIYLVGPFLGAALAAFFSRFMSSRDI